MKTLLTSAALALTLTAGTATADNADIVMQFYEGLNTGNPAAFDAALADDWVVYGTSPSLPTMDMGQYLQSLGTIAAAFENSNYEVDAVHVAGDFVTVRGTITGTHAGPLFGVEGSGNAFEFGAIDIHRVENGEIAESWHVEDFMTLFAQIGGMDAVN